MAWRGLRLVRTGLGSGILVSASSRCGSIRCVFLGTFRSVRVGVSYFWGPSWVVCGVAIVSLSLMDIQLGWVLFVCPFCVLTVHFCGGFFVVMVVVVMVRIGQGGVIRMEGGAVHCRRMVHPCRMHTLSIAFSCVYIVICVFFFVFWGVVPSVRR